MTDIETPLYNELKLRKENGETLILEDITYEMMKELWWKEMCFDWMLAPLFNVSKYKIKNYRYKLGLNQQNMIYENIYQNLTT